MAEIVYKEKTRERMARNDRITEAYKQLRKENPDVSAERIFATIALDYNISSAAIRAICAKTGVYANRKNQRRA